MTPPPVFATVPRRWPGETFVCLGGGPSLTQADVDAVRGYARVIAINDAYRLAPWADVLYACDFRWWRWHQGVPAFTGVRYALTVSAGKWPGVQVLRNVGVEGLSRDPTGLKTGLHSGYQAINLAVHLGASRILLLGYDMQGGHWFGAHPDHSLPPFEKCLRAFETIVQPLNDAGVEVINCSRESALPVFPRRPLAEMLARREVAA